MDDLLKKASRVKELNKLVIKAVAEWDIEQLAKYVDEYRELKKEIKSVLMEHPVVNIPDIRDKYAREILQKISSGEILPVERAFQGSILEEYFIDKLEEDEIEQLGSDLFYSWFSHYEYIEGLYNIGSLILAVGKIPEYLAHFVSEARSCYAFQQYSAVYSLCRTILEISIRDVCVRNGIIQDKSEKVKPLEYYELDLHEMIVKICKLTKYKPLKERLNNIRLKTNFLIHGNKTISGEEAKDMLRETLKVVQELCKQS